jgi:hypothetical protein
MSEYQELVRLNTELRNERDSARTRLGAAEKKIDVALDALGRARADLLHHGYHGTEPWIDAAIAVLSEKEEV